MTPDPAIMKSVEKLGYRVSVGDVASHAGLEINQAQKGLLALAADAGGHLQVAESGEIAYLFPKNFRSILRNKFWQLRWQEWWERVWGVLFYLIRISFGIILVISILLMVAAIAIILIAMSNSEGEGDSGGGSSRRGGGFSFPGIWFFPDIFWIFDPSYDHRQVRSRRSSNDSEKGMNFLEAIFSFLFGDGDPNVNLEERRWQAIGGVIRNYNGAIAAEQIAPYCDEISAINLENEDYVLPALARFNGYPQVSDVGEIIYYFPELQISATRKGEQSVAPYLKEKSWRFSSASSGQVMLAIGLGAANLILAMVLGSLLQGNLAAELGGLVAFVDSIYWLLLGYGSAFLAVPLIRYFWIQYQNSRIESRNQKRSGYLSLLNSASVKLQEKLAYAKHFAAHKVIDEENLAYTTQTDLLEQDINRSEQIDAQWERRLESGS